MLSNLSRASFALRKCAEDSRDESNDQSVDAVLHNFYVDDCLKSVHSEEEAMLMYHTASRMWKGWIQAHQVGK